MKKLAGHRIFSRKIGGHKKNQVMIGGVTKLLNIPVIAVAVFQNFPRYALKKVRSWLCIILSWTQKHHFLPYFLNSLEKKAGTPI